MVKPRFDVVRSVRGALGPYGQAFWDELVDGGYAARSAETHLMLMARLSRWMELVSLELDDLDADRIGEFMAWNRTMARFPKSAEGAVPMLVFLRNRGVIPAVEPAVLSAEEELLVRLDRYLRSERGLTSGTTWNYVHAARLFLAALGGEGARDLGRVTAGDVTAFVVTQCEGRTLPAAKNLVCGVRALLRFLHVEGITAGSLLGAAPTVSGWSGGGIPRGVDTAAVRALLSSCDRRTAKGRRDFAILTVLAVLGLRAGEVAALDLDDIDWANGALVVRGKANRVERMPLPTDVGRAMAGYVQRSRPATADRALFVRVVAPHRRITVGAISVLVHAACDRAGIAPIATHRLRHTVASELLRNGAGLAEIGQVLRHRSAASTARYAKVDTVALRRLARPWPGAAA
jgi:site-specific recombinase XerD